LLLISLSFIAGVYYWRFISNPTPLSFGHYYLYYKIKIQNGCEWFKGSLSQLPLVRPTRGCVYSYLKNTNNNDCEPCLLLCILQIRIHRRLDNWVSKGNCLTLGNRHSRFDSYLNNKNKNEREKININFIRSLSF